MQRWITASEIRLALRLIARQPVLSLTIVLALATGVGLAVTGFTLREAVLFSPLPFANGDRFVRLVMHSEAEDNVEVDLDGYHAIRDTSKAFAHLGAHGGLEFALENADGTVEAIKVNLITPRSFQFLPAVPMIGRVLNATDGASGAEPVVVLRESLWRRRFGASAEIIGEPIQLSDRRPVVVGVLPDTFKFPAGGELWLPLDEATLAGRASSLTVFGILREGLTIAGATAELSAYSRGDRPRQPGTAISFRALPFTGDDEGTTMVMSALVALLVLALLVVASNIASLVFARTWSRSSELAVRTAIGAGRARLVGQLFAEVAILCAIASAIGLALAQTALRFLAGMMDIPFWMSFEPTAKTMAFVVVVSFAISVVSGLMPALQVTRANLIGALHAQGRGLTPTGFGSVGRVLVIEVALAVVLLNCALVTARAYSAYLDDIPALPKGQVLTARLSGEQSKEVRDRML
ncbi:MAG TPA: ABC transporter permease, partial [Vicinamibacterales bacterium]